MHYLEMCCVFNEQLNFWRLLVPWSMLRKADALNLVIKWVWNLCKCNNWGFHLCHKIVFKQGLNTDDIIDKLPELQLKWSNVYGCVLVDPEPCCSGKPMNHEGICIYSSGCQNEQCLKASTGRLLGCRTLAYRKNAKCDEYNIMLISNKKASLQHQTLWFVHQWSCILETHWVSALHENIAVKHIERILLKPIYISLPSLLLSISILCLLSIMKVSAGTWRVAEPVHCTCTTAMRRGPSKRDQARVGRRSIIGSGSRIPCSLSSVWRMCCPMFTTGWSWTWRHHFSRFWKRVSGL